MKNKGQGNVRMHHKQGWLACSQIRPLIPEFVVGVLDDPLHDVVLLHLLRCASCRKEALKELAIKVNVRAFVQNRYFISAESTVKPDTPDAPNQAV